MESTRKRIGVSTVPSDLKKEREREDLERAISITIDLLAINRGTLTLRNGLVTKGRPIRWSIEPKVAAPFVGGTGTLCQPPLSIKEPAAPPSSPPNYHQKTRDIFYLFSGRNTHWIPTHKWNNKRQRSKYRGIITALGTRVLIIRCTPLLPPAQGRRVCARVPDSLRDVFLFIVVIISNLIDE